MARPLRQAVADIVYHVINRSNGRTTLFRKDADYQAIERTLEEAKLKHPLRIYSYAIMPNHWHLVLCPYQDGDISRFMRWLTLTHTNRWHAHYHNIGSGHLYQGRFKSFPVESDQDFIQFCQYVERNALRASRVEKAEDWNWSSLWRRLYGTEEQKQLLDSWPMLEEDDYLKLINQPESEITLESIRESMIRGKPFGSSNWVSSIADKLGLNSTLRSRGRPRKTHGKGT